LGELFYNRPVSCYLPLAQAFTKLYRKALRVPTASDDQPQQGTEEQSEGAGLGDVRREVVGFQVRPRAVQVHPVPVGRDADPL